MALLLRNGVIAAVLAVSLIGCCKTAPADFVVSVNKEQFVIRLVNRDQIAAARAMLDGNQPHRRVMGELRDGDGGFNRDPAANKKWSWHLDPKTVSFFQNAMEVCDGLPSHVENDKETWLNKVKRFCPWKSRIERELTTTADSILVKVTQGLPDKLTVGDAVSYSVTTTGGVPPISWSGKPAQWEEKVTEDGRSYTTSGRMPLQKLEFSLVAKDSQGTSSDPHTVIKDASPYTKTIQATALEQDGRVKRFRLNFGSVPPLQGQGTISIWIDTEGLANGDTLQLFDADIEPKYDVKAPISESDGLTKADNQEFGELFDLSTVDQRKALDDGVLHLGIVPNGRPFRVVKVMLTAK